MPIVPPNNWKGRYTEDSYGRREYLGYSVSNTTELIRRIQTRTPGFVIPDFATVMIYNRASAPADTSTHWL